jgi:AraC-like DNA-binding protein
VLRRRLLLERAAWQLAHGYTTADVAAGAGYGPTAAFSHAFARAHGSPPSRHRGPFVITGHRPFCPSRRPSPAWCSRCPVDGTALALGARPALDLATLGRPAAPTIF